MPQLRTSWSRRLPLVVAGGAMVAVISCDSTLSLRPDEVLWGFITVSALEDGAGADMTSPNAVFFRGAVSSIPNSASRPDSCFPAGSYVPPINDFGNVAYLDAGEAISVRLGSATTELPRVSSGGRTTYTLGAGTVPFNGGDSIVVNIPGATGGYPTSVIRGKIPEALDLDPIAPSATDAIQLRWNASSDDGSSLIVSLQFAPAGGNGEITREIRCAFRDDGVDSIKLAQHEDWSDPTNLKRQVIATRLRTVLQNVGDGGLQIIATYQDPLPKQ